MDTENTEPIVEEKVEEVAASPEEVVAEDTTITI
jgi:hypothetical protein